MHELWQHGLERDDEVPDDIKEKWKKLFKEFAAQNSVDFDRCLKPSNAIEDPGLLCSAMRPLTELSIPRLELQAAVIASRLAKTICKQSRFTFSRSVYFTDSLVVLTWIQSMSRCYKPFISRRIGEIQSNSEPFEWMCCPTQLNVTDDILKGIPTTDLNGQWMNGPVFLQQPQAEWPNQEGTPEMSEVNKERRKTTLAHAVIICKEPMFRPEDFSTWKRLRRVTAYVLRFIHNCRKLTTRRC